MMDSMYLFTGYAAEDNVGQMFEKALMCFNNKFVSGKEII